MPHDQLPSQPQSSLEELTGLPDRIKLPIAFDADALQADVERLRGAEWTAHFVPDHYEGEWSALPLRAPAGATHPILRIAANPCTDAWAATEWLERSACLKHALSQFRCDIEGVRLMRLAPGSAIKEHRDERLSADMGHARLHVPIVTGERVDFRLNGTSVAMAPGDTWYLRVSDPHSVSNRGHQDRIHLVIDAVVNSWLAALLRQGARA